MAIALGSPRLEDLDDVLGAMRGWQDDGTPVQLHPGDLGWYWRFGASETAAAVRTWRRNGRIVAAGLLDEVALLRLAIAPDAQHDAALARQLAADLTAPARGVLGPGDVRVEAPPGALLRDLLLEAGWRPDELWTQLHRELTPPMADPGIRIEVIGPERADVRSAVQRAAFDGSTFTDQRWSAMAAGPAYADARCLVAYDDRGEAVATATVWCAGPGRRGLLEPVGVHRDHRGRGYGTAIVAAAAAALLDLGSSSAIVSTPSSNVGAVAAYRSAGFGLVAEVPDLRRHAEEE